MKNILHTFQKNMMAATFAEAGEWETARDMAPDIELSHEPTWLNKLFMAITFAESGMDDEALRFLRPGHTGNRGYHSKITEDLGLRGVQLAYGTISI
jgi:hypothetical protein